MVAIIEEKNEFKFTNQNLKKCRGYLDVNGKHYACNNLFSDNGMRRKVRCDSCTNLHNLAKKEFKKWLERQPRVRCKGYRDSDGKYHSCSLLVKKNWISGRCGACNAKQKISDIERGKNCAK